MEFWQVEWGNGCTDVFLDIEDAEACYRPDVDRNIMGAEDSLKHAKTGGEWRDETEITSEGHGAVWSEAAKAAAKAAGLVIE